MKRLGSPGFDETDNAFAEQKKNALTKEEIVSSVAPYKIRPALLSVRRCTRGSSSPQGNLTAARKGMVLAAKAMATTAVDCLRDPDIITRAKAELKEHTGGRRYICPIPRRSRQMTWVPRASNSLPFRERY